MKRFRIDEGATGSLLLQVLPSGVVACGLSAFWLWTALISPISPLTA
jgi:hypothetical protein